ncbi:hypothetical protein GARC_4019 [Paraglaciecola arctica BSs20135]|uniref:Uncharacterized protein n=1 Tax=Paraglaciecola arctica BSs20135 TaxID=493475 RepID=K6YAJ3_9ALTE|nr:hypothetical protein GARC_4019 [Paraglaciecola arctica BSs20135]
MSATFNFKVPNLRDTLLLISPLLTFREEASMYNQKELDSLIHAVLHK